MREKRVKTGSRLRDRRFPESGLAALEGENQSVNGDRFGERHSDDGDNEDVAEGTGIAAHSLGGSKADESDSDTGTRTGNAEGEGTVGSAGTEGVEVFSGGGGAVGEHGDDVHHGSIILLVVVLFVACRRPLTRMVTAAKWKSMSVRVVVTFLVRGGELEEDRIQHGEDHALKDSDEEFEEVEWKLK